MKLFAKIVNDFLFFCFNAIGKDGLQFDIFILQSDRFPVNKQTNQIPEIQTRKTNRFQAMLT